MPEPSSTHFCPIPRIHPGPSGKIHRDEQQDCLPREETEAVATGNEQEKQRKPVICFQCGLISLVPQSAISTHCHHCDAYISLDDVILWKKSVRRIIQTRGNVLVKSGSNFTGLTIQSHNLKLEGQVSGNFDCSGMCSIRCSQTFNGTLKAHTLQVDKKCAVKSARPAELQNASIHGTYEGDIEATGTVTIHKTGQVHGNITVPHLIIEEGGEHHGQHTIPH